MGIGYRHLKNIIIIKLKKHDYDVMIISRTEDFFLPSIWKCEQIHWTGTFQRLGKA
jgi:hypothetical protein